MAGIVGTTGGARPFDHVALVDRMAARLVYHGGSRPVHWRAEDHAAMCGVRAAEGEDGPRPLVSDSTGVCVVFFGECVGYEDEKRELERRGHTFRAAVHSDTEFCLRLYEEYGRVAFSRLSGSFCIAIYDPRTRESLLVSDRLGSRPLFYGLGSTGELVFATQVSAVLEAPGISRALDTGAILEFCANQRVFGTKTHHLGVKIVGPASVLQYRDGRISVDSYWTLNYRPVPGSLDEYAEELAATVRRAVSRLTAGRQRTALLLSGGLDARMILAAADTELSCYTFGDYENFETEVARRVCRIKGFPFRFLQRPTSQYADMVAAGVDIGSGMHAFNHAHALGFIDEIRKECDTITHGYGTEILFRGTSLPRRTRKVLGIHVGTELDPELREAQLRQRILDRGYSLTNKGIRDLLVPHARQMLDDRLAATTAEIIDSSKGHAANVFDAFLWPDIFYRGRFPSFLFELSMRPFIAERSIDFDNDIIDLHLRMPVEIRFGNQLWLRAMELLHRGVAHTVTANTGYSPFTHPAMISVAERARSLVGMPSRRTSGMQAARAAAGTSAAGLSPISWPRFDAMIRENSTLRGMITDTLNDPLALSPDIFDHASIMRLVDDHLAGRANVRGVLFALLTLGQWCKKYAH